MKVTCVVQVEVDEFSVISIFNDINKDKWNHSLVTNVGVTKLTRSEVDRLHKVINLNDMESYSNMF